MAAIAVAAEVPHELHIEATARRDNAREYLPAGGSPLPFRLNSHDGKPASQISETQS
jgi:hypothetical protein